MLDEAEHFRTLAATGDALVFAPHISRHEVANSLATACGDGRLNWEVASRDLRGFFASGVSLDDDPDWLMLRACVHAIAFGTSIYDVMYVGLAEGLGAQLVTADQKFYNRVRNHLSFVHHLGDINVS